MHFPIRNYGGVNILPSRITRLDRDIGGAVCFDLHGANFNPQDCAISHSEKIARCGRAHRPKYLVPALQQIGTDQQFGQCADFAALHASRKAGEGIALVGLSTGSRAKTDARVARGELDSALIARPVHDVGEAGGAFSFLLCGVGARRRAETGADANGLVWLLTMLAGADRHGATGTDDRVSGVLPATQRAITLRPIGPKRGVADDARSGYTRHVGPPIAVRSRLGVVAHRRGFAMLNYTIRRRKSGDESQGRSGFCTGRIGPLARVSRIVGRACSVYFRFQIARQDRRRDGGTT